MLLPLIALVAVIVFSSVFGGMYENFETEQKTVDNQTLICENCKSGTCTCKVQSKTTKAASKTAAQAVKTDAKDTEEVDDEDKVDEEDVGKHPLPYHTLVERVKKAEEEEKKQSKHIDNIRKVLANTITSLRKDDVLPSGTHCSCASAPIIDPLTGEVDLTEGCRPPGWLRMMNTRNSNDEDCRE